MAWQRHSTAPLRDLSCAIMFGLALGVTPLPLLTQSVHAATRTPIVRADAAYQTGNYAAAAVLYRQVADQAAHHGFDDGIAEYNLGHMYELGQGVTQDYTQAVEWYQKAVAHLAWSKARVSLAQTALIRAATIANVQSAPTHRRRLPYLVRSSHNNHLAQCLQVTQHLRRHLSLIAVATMRAS